MQKPIADFTYKELDGNIENCLCAITKKLKAGQMSVMIGAGFSKNANPQYPTWVELLVDAYYEIYGKCEKELTDNEISNIKKEINKNPSAIAQKYIDIKGRREDLDIYIEDVLNSVECEIKNDLQLHEKLLSINWNDVITTNWDTLLERANKDRYLIIKSAKELRKRNCKRVIKINGSLRDDKERKEKNYSFDDCFDYLYVITENDFDKYHIDHPEFSIFMKMKMLQDSFCLIGFSGNDLNFRYWVKELKRTMTKGGNTKEPNFIFLIDTSSDSPDEATLQYYRNNYIVRISLKDAIDKKVIIDDTITEEKHIYQVSDATIQNHICSMTKNENYQRLSCFFNHLEKNVKEYEITPINNYDNILQTLGYPFIDNLDDSDIRKYNTLLPHFYFNNLYYAEDIIRNVYNHLENIDLCNENKQILLFIKHCYHEIFSRIDYIEPNDIINTEINELIAQGYKLSYEYVDKLLQKKHKEEIKPNEDVRYAVELFKFPPPDKVFPKVIRVFNFLEYTGIPAYICLKEIQLINLIEENKGDELVLCKLLLISIPFFGNSSTEELLRTIVPNILRYLKFDTLKDLYNKIFKIIKYKIDKNINPRIYIYLITEIIKRILQDGNSEYISYILEKIEEKNEIIISNISAGEVWGWKKLFIEIIKHIKNFEDYKKILTWVMSKFCKDCEAYSKTNSCIFISEFFPYYVQLITDDKFINEKKEFFKSKVGKELIAEDMKYERKLACL